jgi:uncharacterized protein
MKTETRYFQYAVRAGSDRTLTGLIPYSSLSQNLGGFRERIQRGAFSDSIKSGKRIMSFWNHDTSKPLGSTSANTLKLEDRSDGLHFTIFPPPNSWGDDVVTSVKRGDVSGASFGFRCLEDSWEQKNEDRIRTLVSCELLEISPCSFPAYTESVVRGQRGTAMINDTIKNLLQERAKLLTEMRALGNSAEERAQFDKMNEDFDDMTRKIEIEKKELVMRFGPGAEEAGDQSWFKPDPEWDKKHAQAQAVTCGNLGRACAISLLGNIGNAPFQKWSSKSAVTLFDSSAWVMQG